MASVDGTDFDIMEQVPFYSGWWSKKMNGTALRYEIAIAIKTGYIVWLLGPYPAGSYSDIKIFRSHLKHLLMMKPGERVEADQGYRGERKYVDTKDDMIDSLARRDMKNLVRSRHETVNGRLTQFSILNDRFRFNIKKHRHVMASVCVIVQIQFENGHPPWQITDSEYSTYHFG